MPNNEPFLKWAGGKRWLVSQHAYLLPAFEGRYIEPFLGGGSVFFHVGPRAAILADCNRNLIEAYTVVRDHPQALHRRLSLLHTQHDQDFYYWMRDQAPATKLERAARFIYLNRTCWNGLYRVNRKGEFNVPIGTKTTVEFPVGFLTGVSRALRGVDLVHADFEATIDRAAAGDFVFVDPPYTVSHNNNGFVKYNDVIFAWADQIRLARAVQRAAERGAFIFVSNANHNELTRLYEGFATQYVLSRSSVLSGMPKGRRSTEESAFLTYTPPVLEPAAVV